MSQNIAFKRHLDDLYFNMLEYFNFEKEFIYNLPKNYISTYVICLVDAEEIENWKSINSYDSCLDFLENCDTINFEKFQIKLLNQKQNLQKNFRKKFVSYETLDEVCHSLKKGGRISVIGNQFLCYVNNTTYTKKCFKCYTKNNQLIIYFGSGKSIFIPKFFPDKILDSENVFIVDLPGDNNCFIEAIFDNNNRYQNMYESIKSCGSKIDKDLKMSMTNLLSYYVDKNEMKKFKNYNFLPILKDMIKRDILRNNGHVSFGGGEVTLLKEFDKLLHMFIDAGFPLTRIHSSCIKYSKAIERGLKEGKVDLIVSVDAGSKEMHRKIKQDRSYEKVWKNLKRYASHQKDPYAVKAKYILIPGINDKKEEIDLWLQKAKENGVNCVFHEIESKWFYARRDNVPDEIIAYFDYAKEKAEKLGLKYVLYERAEHMMQYRNEKKEQKNAGIH